MYIYIYIFVYIYICLYKFYISLISFSLFSYVVLVAEKGRKEGGREERMGREEGQREKE